MKEQRGRENARSRKDRLTRSQSAAEARLELPRSLLAAGQMS